ncbi:hypothetical protein CWI42_060300 [Ordospora colligata]|uniref:C3H1-type domain-containing protein n=1 Tax=Ordospora colligata OC4 TaxID=1354746 RepID=A0A0B2UKF8_9MICR|nr:uncharacterized protein M896_060300 [Ordospora colligata OC4]KHN69532.1 hypothetical protein M896_060300 [Ordospora colligata OC4]TBU15352.1 hypothetical protein CWI41_060290 [Ordospora colligata]TBU15452.1 hypothetical protein CWI40_060290 [Ordospora colligata]TBU18548.1 hypothetical protein CWI42_060300 [Ordospora colligata]
MVDDCYFFLYSECKFGGKCLHRHNETCRNNVVTCKNWKAGGTCENECPFRHSEYHCKKNRREEMCYWEDKPSGCTKVKCEYRHLDSLKDAWKNNPTTHNMESIPKCKINDVLDHKDDTSNQCITSTVICSNAYTDTTSLKDYEDVVDNVVCEVIQSDINSSNNFSRGDSSKHQDEIEGQNTVQEKKSISVEKENDKVQIHSYHSKSDAKSVTMMHEPSSMHQTDPESFYASKLHIDKCIRKPQIENGHDDSKPSKKHKASNTNTSDASSGTTVILEELDKDIEELDSILADQ